MEGVLAVIDRLGRALSAMEAEIAQQRQENETLRARLAELEPKDTDG